MAAIRIGDDIFNLDHFARFYIEGPIDTDEGKHYRIVGHCPAGRKDHIITVSKSRERAADLLSGIEGILAAYRYPEE